MVFTNAPCTGFLLGKWRPDTSIEFPSVLRFQNRSGRKVGPEQIVIKQGEMGPNLNGFITWAITPKNIKNGVTTLLIIGGCPNLYLWFNWYIFNRYPKTKNAPVVNKQSLHPSYPICFQSKLPCHLNRCDQSVTVPDRIQCNGPIPIGNIHPQRWKGVWEPPCLSPKNKAGYLGPW